MTHTQQGYKLQQTLLNSNDYWFVYIEKSDCRRCTIAHIHKVTGVSVSCPRALQQSRCLNQKPHRVKTFHPAAWLRGVDCCLRQKKRKDIAVQSGIQFASKVQECKTAKFSLPSVMSVLFLIHKPATGLAQLKVKSLVLREQDNLY